MICQRAYVGLSLKILLLSQTFNPNHQATNPKFQPLNPKAYSRWGAPEDPFHYVDHLDPARSA